MKLTLTLLSSLLFTLLIINPVRACCWNDNVAPVAICDAHTVVSLSNTGTAKVYATDIDDGSYDNCHIAEYKVRRMTQGWCPAGVADDTQFRPYVEFCCEDVGNTIWVVMRVVDNLGNYNECMAEVTVQDNSTPHITCPPNITVSCGFNFNDDCLYNPYNHTFGTCVGNGGTCQPIIINDPGNSSCNQPYNWGYDGSAGGGCGGNAWINICDVIDYRNACGVGIIKRKFCVEMGYWSEYCYQTITVKDFSHSYYSINWPQDYTANACLYTVDELDPNDIPAPYNKPTFPGYDAYNHGCTHLAFAHEDLVFTFSDGACKKILRTWTVIDWCKYQPNNPWTGGIWTHIQVIKLMNATPPHFVNYCSDVVVDGYEPYCSGRYQDSPYVDDDCTPTDSYNWDWKIDINNDGSYNVSGYGSGQPYVDKVLPNGWHKILWNVCDACGNCTTCSHKIHVIDKKAPSPVCYYGLSSVVMPLGGMVTIWAKDFNASSSDNCTPNYKLKYSFSANPYDASRTFTCDDVGTVPIQVWVTDEYGNSDYCTTFIKITDNASTCGSMHLVSGAVTTFTNIGVPHTSAAMAKIMPDQSLDGESEATSDAAGHFSMGFGTTQFDRMIKLSREGKPLEGISTLDLIALKRHISGTQPITEAYKLFAADLDGSGRVGANDLLLLRNALFGAYQLPSYAGNLSWVFFGDPCSPGTPEDLYNNYCHDGVEINHNGSFPANASFKAIKMGDVNGDMVNTAWLLAPRTATNFEINVSTNEVTGTQDFILSKDANLYGFQMSLKAKGLDLIEGALPVNTSNLAVDHDGISRISWGQAEPVSLKKGTILFSVAHLPTDISLNQLLVQDEESLYPEVYTDKLQNQKLELKAVVSGQTITSFETIVSPNPFSDGTTLKITIPAGEEFRVTLFNMKGQELFNQTYFAYTNKSEISIGNDLIQAPGIYYYKVISTLGELSGKFVKQ
ncbi:MAG TPA: T9SS type A sorting domain-containing protein [Saprospiraceae bacterium]|nr:T9SS type A sorting domain-containing protein [Saprospiraceae bacterium]